MAALKKRHHSQQFYLWLTLFFCTSMVGHISAQGEKKFEWSMEGQIAVTTNGKAVFTNFGGPGLRFNFKHFSIGYNMMPSLRFEATSGHSFVAPMLGTGPQIYLLKKKLVISAPAYYSAITQEWTYSVGLGYVLTNRR